MQQILIFHSRSFVSFILLSFIAACTASSDLSTHGSKKGSLAVAPDTTIHYVSDLPPEPGPDLIPLINLDPFQDPPEGWNIYGKVYTSFPGEPLGTIPGTGILMFDGPSGGEGQSLRTRTEHGSGSIELEYMLQAGSCFSLMLQSRYEIRMCGNSHKKSLGHEKPGTIHYGDSLSISPLINASRAPGVWQKLVIDFQAPKFDASGKKINNARIERLRLNGGIIHRAIELPDVSTRAGADSEIDKAPLAFHVDSVAAFRNIGFYDDDQQIQITNLHYAYHEENLEDDQALMRATPVQQGPATQITAALAGRGNNFALIYTGTLQVPKSGTYTFESFARGQVTLQVDGRTLIQPTPQPDNPLYISLTDIVDGTIDLESGTHTFMLQYKKMQRGSSSLSVYVTGPGIKHALTSGEDAWRPPVQAIPMPLEPVRRPLVVRSRVDNRDKMVLKGVSVGDPKGIHYSLDVENAALLQVWHDAFLDGGPIWTGRGMDLDTRMLAPVGIPESKISFSGRPAIAFLQDDKEAWPDSVDSSFRFLGYTTEGSGKPVFRYQFDDLEVHEEFRPGKTAYTNSLTREVSLENEGDSVDIWFLLADGTHIECRSDGVYSIDDQYFLEIPPGFDVHHRQSGGRDELILRIPASTQTTSFTTTLNW